MSNYTGPDRRTTPDRRSAEETNAQFKAILRWALTLSSVAMLVFAGLTYFGVLPFPAWSAFIFVAVAAIDLCIAYVVFGPVTK